MSGYGTTFADELQFSEGYEPHVLLSWIREIKRVTLIRLKFNLDPRARGIAVGTRIEGGDYRCSSIPYLSILRRRISFWKLTTRSLLHRSWALIERARALKYHDMCVNRSDMFKCSPK